MNSNVLWFKEINKDMISVAGGKGANLGEMINAGFPVPDGFVITAKAYETSMTGSKILSKIEEIEKNIDVNNTKELNEKSKLIKDLILKTPIIKEVEKDIRKKYIELGKTNYVAVRSSATAEDLPSASFAGQQDTFLNIVGEDNVLIAVRKAWASLFNARAIFYRRKQNFPINNVKIAIVVQKMVNSEISGIMFSANPVSSNRDEVVIEAGYGLGEAIVSGSVTPDTYVYSKSQKKIIDKSISKQTWKYVKSTVGDKKVDVEQSIQEVQKLNEDKIIELAKIGLNIESHYKKPQDMEWALEDNKLYIVQSRPITTLTNDSKTSTEDEEIKFKAILSGLGASKGFATGPCRVVIDMSDLDEVKEGDILVTTMTTPDMVPAMRRAKGIITNEGGITSHAAIVSRELGIPAVVGTTKATQILKNNQIVTIDANKGKIYDGKVEHRASTEEKENLDDVKNIQFLTSTKVKVNVALPEAALRAARTGADGIGLLRAEHLITSTGKHPIYMINNGMATQLKDLIKEELRKVAVNFKDKPIYYRTFDARTDEFRQLKGGDEEPHEANPMLGWHGVRRSLDVPELIRAEFIAIRELREEGFDNIGVMIPFTQNVREYELAKELAMSVGLIPHKMCLFGIMVETPGASLTIEEYISKGLDFVSFGTNDLTQLTLGIDRNNERIQKWFSELHPAVLKQIAHVIQKCREANVSTSICGQAGSNPEMVKKLVELGIDSVSSNIDAVKKIREVVYQTERELVLESIRKRNLETIKI